MQLAASFDSAGREITPAQTLACDTLVIAEGSLEMASGKVISSSIAVRSAGVEAADLMKTIGAAEDGSGALEISELD